MVGEQLHFDPNVVQPMPQRPEPRPRPTPQQAVEGLPNPQLIDMAKAIRSILATRMLLMFAIIVASGIWGITSYQPTELRIVAACAFSSLVVWPLVWLFYRKG